MVVNVTQRTADAAEGESRATYVENHAPLVVGVFPLALLTPIAAAGLVHHFLVTVRLRTCLHTHTHVGHVNWGFPGWCMCVCLVLCIKWGYWVCVCKKGILVRLHTSQLWKHINRGYSRLTYTLNRGYPQLT